MTDPKATRHVEALVETILSHDHVEDVLRKGLEAVLSTLMEAEVEAVTGAGHGQRTDDRKTNRNGYRERTFNTGLGTSQLRIPKVRRGTYFPSFLQAHKRSDDALVLAVARCYQQGVSTGNVEAIVKALGVDSLKSSTVSEMAAALEPQVKAFGERELPRCAYVYLDARYEHVREDHAVRKVAVLVAVGVRMDGHREVLGFAIERVENEAYWRQFIEGLVERGLRGVELVVSDAHVGLRKAIEKALPSARWQRCKVHFLRNLGSRVRRNERPAYLALAKTIFAQPDWERAIEQRRRVVEAYREAGQHDAADFLESSDEVLTFMEFPQEHWSKLHSTNMVERLNRELKRRTRVVSIFPNRKSLGRLVGALLLEQHEEWIVGRRYISERSMKALLSEADQVEACLPGASGLLAAK